MWSLQDELENSSIYFKILRLLICLKWPNTSASTVVLAALTSNMRIHVNDLNTQELQKTYELYNLIWSLSEGCTFVAIYLFSYQYLDYLYPTTTDEWRKSNIVVKRSGGGKGGRRQCASHRSRKFGASLGHLRQGRLACPLLISLLVYNFTDCWRLNTRCWDQWNWEREEKWGGILNRWW